MRPVEELIDLDEPAWPHVRELLGAARNAAEVLPPPEQEARRTALHAAQVTTRSAMGAIVYESGGILIDRGWIRVLGGGHPRLPRSLPEWNLSCDVNPRSGGLYLVADDVLGGFFALNGGGLSEGDPGHVFYLAPDTLAWGSLGLGYADFMRWLLAGDLALFYSDQRWPDWESEVGGLRGDEGFSIYPFLWAEGPPVQERSRHRVPMAELWSFALSSRAQLSDSDEPSS